MRSINYMSALLMAWLTITLGCVSQDYAGRSYQPTEYVAVFYSEKEVKKPFTIMGRDRAETTEYLHSEQVIEQIVKEAQKRGADGVIIDNIKLVSVGSTTNTFGHQQDKEDYYATADGKLHSYHKNSGHYYESSHTTTTRNKVIKARFIKYK